MKTALISVSDKKNLDVLVECLIINNYSIISTGGTYDFIKSKISEEKLIKVDDFTGFPEILNGRVKTLHPKVYGGILFDPADKNHYENFLDEKLNLQKIDMVVVNLYPFEETISSENFSEEEAIEKIDIGGVSLLRAAAKNYKNVIVLPNPDRYKNFIDDLKFLETSEMERKKYASEAFEIVTHYDQVISNYFNPKIEYKKFRCVDKLKYGCNPYQKSANIYQSGDKIPLEVINGEPGYINYLDAISSWCLVVEAEEALRCTVSASFKHTAPAGVGTSKYDFSEAEKKIYEIDKYELENSPSGKAFIRARNCDPLSSFGDFIAISGVVDETCALLIKREITDGIIANDYTEKALEILRKKKSGKYIIIKGDKEIKLGVKEFREVFGITLSQKSNSEKVDRNYLKKIVTENNDIPEDKKDDLILATVTLKYTPSNSVVITDKCQAIGIGAGQQNRVDCVKLSGNKAKIFKLRFNSKVLELWDKFKPGVTRQGKINCVTDYINNDFTEKELQRWLKNFEGNNVSGLIGNLNYEKSELCMSSDGFFPFRDNIDYANKFGVKYIVNPGGSVNDVQIVEACNEHDICMVMSGKRLFLH